MKKFCCFFFCLVLSLVPVSAVSRTLIVCGDTVMINAQYDGVFISGDFDFHWKDQLISSHPLDSVQVHDMIIEANGNIISSCKELNRVISEVSITKNFIDVKVLRNQIEHKARLYLYFDENDNTFKTGFYIKDHINGVGTLTYYDPLHHSYGALGHEITEKSTGKRAEVHLGHILLGKVTSVVPSVINQPGEKISRSTDMILGNILINNEFGLFGKTNVELKGRELEIALQHQIHPGKAVLLTVIDSTNLMEVDIEITKVNLQSSQGIKGIEFKITDQRLIEKTGGIVQGMSGSPILQNGRIIGAVTHMIPSSPTRGYGVFIEWMLYYSDQI
ncbi:MAG: stage IV sporulation protein B [Erysipelotrichaceae bacterium]|nr:stage IV sporulation protein B [Erysipelotrichaceae bacterium]